MPNPQTPSPAAEQTCKWCGKQIAQRAVPSTLSFCSKSPSAEHEPSTSQPVPASVTGEAAEQKVGELPPLLAQLESEALLKQGRPWAEMFVSPQRFLDALQEVRALQSERDQLRAELVSARGSEHALRDVLSRLGCTKDSTLETRYRNTRAEAAESALAAIRGRSFEEAAQEVESQIAGLVAQVDVLDVSNDVAALRIAAERIRGLKGCDHAG